MEETATKERIQVKAGEVLLYPGPTRPTDPLYRVERGFFRLQHMNKDGGALTLRFVGPGGYLGEEVLTGRDRTYFAEAMTDAEVVPVPHQELDEEGRRELLIGLAEAIEDGYQRIRRLAGQRLKNRIAAALLELAETPLAKPGPEGSTVVRLTHEDLAAAVGSMREAVTKAVGELSRDGYLELGYGKIFIVDPEGLRELARRRE